MSVPLRVVACLTSHNRCVSTLAALVRLQQAAHAAGVQISAILADDGSTDGTAQQVAQRFPWVTVLSGDGALFWNRGMHLAMQRAMDLGDADVLLWLNDDTLLHGDALQRLGAAAKQLKLEVGRPGIVVGATADAHSGRLTYSGCVVDSRWRAFAFRKVGDPTRLVHCHTMNGNVVWLPMSVVRRVGNLDPVFEHAMGDLDYGLRARRAGVPLAVAPGFVGTCSTNPTTGSFLDPALPLRRRWQLFVHRKVLPPRSWRHMTRKHGGVLWPLHFVWPYASFIVRALLVNARKTN